MKLVAIAAGVSVFEFDAVLGSKLQHTKEGDAEDGLWASATTPHDNIRTHRTQTVVVRGSGTFPNRLCTALVHRQGVDHD